MIKISQLAFPPFLDKKFLIWRKTKKYCIWEENSYICFSILCSSLNASRGNISASVILSLSLLSLPKAVPPQPRELHKSSCGVKSSVAGPSRGLIETFLPSTLQYKHFILAYRCRFKWEKKEKEEEKKETKRPNPFFAPVKYKSYVPLCTQTNVLAASLCFQVTLPVYRESTSMKPNLRVGC